MAKQWPNPFGLKIFHTRIWRVCIFFFLTVLITLQRSRSWQCPQKKTKKSNFSIRAMSSCKNSIKCLSGSVYRVPDRPKIIQVYHLHMQNIEMLNIYASRKWKVKKYFNKSFISFSKIPDAEEVESVHAPRPYNPKICAFNNT